MTTQKMPVCTNCWDKGWSSVMESIHGAEDFGGEGYTTKPKVFRRYCECKRGRMFLKEACKNGAVQSLYRLYETK